MKFCLMKSKTPCPRGSSVSRVLDLMHKALDLTPSNIWSRYDLNYTPVISEFEKWKKEEIRNSVTLDYRRSARTTGDT